MTLPDGVVSIIKKYERNPFLTLFCVLPSKYFILLRRMKNTTQVHILQQHEHDVLKKIHSFCLFFSTMNLSLLLFSCHSTIFLLGIYLHFYYIFVVVVVKKTCVYMCVYLYSCVCVMIFQFEIKHKT